MAIANTPINPLNGDGRAGDNRRGGRDRSDRRGEIGRPGIGIPNLVADRFGDGARVFLPAAIGVSFDIDLGDRHAA
jgi:hypothetical protein